MILKRLRSYFSQYFVGELSDKLRRMDFQIQIIERELELESYHGEVLSQNNVDAVSTTLDELVSRMNAIVEGVKKLRRLKLDNEVQSEYIADLKSEREKFLTERKSYESQIEALQQRPKTVPRSNTAEIDHSTPLFMDLIHLRDQLGVMEKNNFPELSDYAGDLAGSLADILEKNGVEILSPKNGSDYDVTSQKIVRTVPFDTAANAGKVAETLRYGYRYNGGLLRHADVEVYNR